MALNPFTETALSITTANRAAQARFARRGQTAVFKGRSHPDEDRYFPYDGGVGAGRLRAMFY